MKITAIKQQIKNPERISVFVEGKYEFSLSLNELIKEKLKNGDELDSSDVKRLKKVSADGKLRARALEWLLNRPRSEREFRDYLYRKKAEPVQIDALVAEFTGRGYLDNAKFADWLVDVQSRRGKSDRAIRAELFKKGIGREAIEESVAAGAGDEAERLKSVIDKKAGLPRYKKDPEKFKQYLLRQGFSYELIKDALNT